MIEPEKFLAEYEKTFGKGADWFKAANIVRMCKENPSSVAVSKSSSEELLRMKDAFERMAFEAAEERNLAAWCINHEIERCEVCAKQPGWTEDCEAFDGNCQSCGKMECPCKSCNYGSNFYFSAAMAKEIKEKEEERTRKNG